MDSLFDVTPSHQPIPRVLSIAGTDPSGGAGTAADTKAISACGGYAMAAVTAVVAQNTCGVRAIHQILVDILEQQLAAVRSDVDIDAIKIGMLGTTETTAVVQDFLASFDTLPPVVIDPVMVATSGDRLLDPEAEQALRGLLRYATLITPNIPELGVLAAQPAATTAAGALKQAQQVAQKFETHVVVKGGHLSEETLSNALVNPAGDCVAEFRSPRIHTTNTHGTGCSLSSALATFLGAGYEPADALDKAGSWITAAVAHGHELRVGGKTTPDSSHGPIHHFHSLHHTS